MKAEPFAEEDRSSAVEAAPNLEFTGERIVPGKTTEALFREHEERYVFAGQYVAGKDVLDVACGAGVGTSYLRQAGARSARGLDIDRAAVAYARARYPDCEFAECDATSLCLADESVDVVVSFETLEHLREQERFLKECRRVLRPGGIFLCSTPNRSVYRWQGANPFHTHELTADEFRCVVSSYFCSVRLFSQVEQIYPFYLVRLLASRTLDGLQLKGVARRAIAWGKAPQGVRQEFARNGHRGLREFGASTRWSFMRPVYLLALGRKVDGDL